MVALLLVGCGSDDSDDGDDPAAVVEAYAEAYDSGDLDGVMAFFAEESVIEDTGEDLAGLTEIRSWHADEVGASSLSVSNVEVSGDTVTWDHLWTNTNGQSWCGTGHSAVVVNGQFQTWAFADTAQCFPD